MTAPDPYAGAAPSAPSLPPTAAEFARRLRARESLLGYWVMLDSPASTERIAMAGYDYVCIDAQHGLLDRGGVLAGLVAVQAGGRSVGLVRVSANEPFAIFSALDAGAAGIIVPLVDGPEDAARAVSSASYPPLGTRSFGPMRSGLRIGPRPAEANAAVSVLVMIETAGGLASVEEICAVPGVDGVYVGPADLGLAIGADYPGDPAVDAEFEAALTRIRTAAAAAGVTAGIHTHDGAEARRRLDEGFTLATVAADLLHVDQAARSHLEAARPHTEQ